MDAIVLQLFQIVHKCNTMIVGVPIVVVHQPVGMFSAALARVEFNDTSKNVIMTMSTQMMRLQMLPAKLAT